MNNKFDELTKTMAQSVTRRVALKKFGVGLAGMALVACFGLANKAEANKAEAKGCKPSGSICQNNSQCCSGVCWNPFFAFKHTVCQ